MIGNEIVGRVFLGFSALLVILLMIGVGVRVMHRWFDIQEQQIEADRYLKARQIRADESSVDTVVSINVDTLYIERPADIVKVTIKEVGELTEADLVNILCPPAFRETKEFWHNALGMVACHNPERK